MTVTLGPGILDNIFDGIQRPLKDIEKASGAFIKRGASVNALDENKLWDVTIDVKKAIFCHPVKSTHNAMKPVLFAINVWFLQIFQGK